MGRTERTQMNVTKENRKQWHPAFFAALNLEFSKNKDDLEFLQEQSVNELPLRIDALIIKKTHNRKIRNEIGELFRWYNIVEYKSPEDELSFNTFLKGIAEVYLYKIKQEKTRIDSYTLSFIRARKPVVLFAILKRYHFSVVEKYLGIYYVTGRNIIPIQIIVTNRLNKTEHIWLNSLTRALSLGQAKELINSTNELQDVKQKRFAEAVWEIVAKANEDLIEKIMEENIMCQALMEIMKPKFDAAVAEAVDAALAVEVPKAVAKVKESAFNDGFNDGFNNGFNDGFNNGFNGGIDDKGIKVFCNMIKRGFSREDAQAMAEISDELVEKAIGMSKK